MPPPYTLVVVGAPPVGRVICAGCPAGCVVAPARVASLKDGVELPRTNRCLSSVSSSLSSPSASKASARSGLTVLDRSLDDVRERNDGGGEFGTGCIGLGKGSVGVSASSSWAFTCDVVNSNPPWASSTGRDTEETRTRSYRPDMVEACDRRGSEGWFWPLDQSGTGHQVPRGEVAAERSV
jgi:hypothetical protein